MSPSGFRLFILVLHLFFSLPLLSSEQGFLIILYGTPCSGKSTLCKQLKDLLPGNFSIVKKGKIVREKRAALIEKATGKKTQGDLEDVERILDQMDEHRKEINQINSNALQKTLKSIRERVLIGENILFDICLTNTSYIEEIEGIRTLKVLVFAPLSTLSERSAKRASDNHYSQSFELRRWVNILIAFHHLFRPIEPGETDLLATASQRELSDLFRKYSFQEDLSQLNKENRKTTKRLGLVEKKWVAIVPKHPPDLFIHTGRTTQEESLKMIASAFEKLKDPDPHTKCSKDQHP